jgi:UrcA family protein
MNSVIAISTAAVLLAAVSGAAQAAPSGRSAVEVSYADLDLARADGRQVLERRLERALDLVCGDRPAALELSRTSQRSACRAAAMADARQQLSQIYNHARRAEAAIVIPVRGR